jgi:hypothetical protein
LSSGKTATERIAPPGSAPADVVRRQRRNAASDSHFSEEAFGTERGGEIGVQDLDGDVAIVLDVVREIDRGHAARAEFALDAVAVGQRRGDARNGLA